MLKSHAKVGIQLEHVTHLSHLGPHPKTAKRQLHSTHIWSLFSSTMCRETFAPCSQNMTDSNVILHFLRRTGVRYIPGAHQTSNNVPIPGSAGCLEPLFICFMGSFLFILFTLIFPCSSALWIQLSAHASQSLECLDRTVIHCMLLKAEPGEEVEVTDLAGVWDLRRP